MIRSNKRQKEQQRQQRKQEKDAKRAEKKQQRRDGTLPKTEELSLEGLPPGTRFNADGSVMSFDADPPAPPPSRKGGADE